MCNKLPQKTATEFGSVTLDFLLNWKIPRRPFFSGLPKLVVLKWMESTQRKQRGRGVKEELDMIVSVPQRSKVNPVSSKSKSPKSS